MLILKDLIEHCSAEASQVDDPVLGQFLCFLANDIARRPERLQFVDPGLPQRLHSLVGAVDVDLDTALSADDESSDVTRPP